jgi:hypothetical protein
MPLETLSAAMNRLHDRGYTESFRPEDGQMLAVQAGRRLDPESLEVDEVVRFEGATDPADEAILFALSVPDLGIRGTWSAAFGPGMDPVEAEMAQRLETRHRPPRT